MPFHHEILSCCDYETTEPSYQQNKISQTWKCYKSLFQFDFSLGREPTNISTITVPSCAMNFLWVWIFIFASRFSTRSFVLRTLPLTRTGLQWETQWLPQGKVEWSYKHLKPCKSNSPNLIQLSNWGIQKTECKRLGHNDVFNWIE